MSGSVVPGEPRFAAVHVLLQGHVDGVLHEAAK
jgi:hypothetical protein